MNKELPVVGIVVIFILLILWSAAILFALFFGEGLFATLKFIREFSTYSQGYAQTLISSSQAKIIPLAIFAFVNALIVFWGSSSQSFAKMFLIIDLFIFIISIIGHIIVGIIFAGPLVLAAGPFARPFGLGLLSVLFHAPLLFLLRNGSNKLAVRVITVLFVLAAIAGPLAVHIYAKTTLPQKVAEAIAHPETVLGFKVFKPSYLPGTKVKLDESANQSDGFSRNRYDISYEFSKDNVSGAVYIEQSVGQSYPKDLKRIIETRNPNVKESTINGNPALIDASDVDSVGRKQSEYQASIHWGQGGTSISLFYRISSKERPDLIEADAIKVAESFK